MKTLNHTIVKLAAGIVLVANLNVSAQTNLQFTAVKATSEGAMQLYWQSEPHHLYEIDEADALVDTNTGSITWNKLYDNYPSHGTNTFIGDFGNYYAQPTIPHPKSMPMRFYRIVDKGADNDTTDIPSVTITSLTNDDVLSGQITVTVAATCSNMPVVTTQLYVDGQEMDESDDGSNYVINTSEWANGSHTLFAVATARSGMSGPSGSWPIYTSHGVSSYLPVTFSNLISSIAFSQPFFEPSLGQTQEVTATFAANCDWTLQIIDESSNIVRTATGSGNWMTFDWDGTGDGETNIPDGVYYYHISAETNGQESLLANDEESNPPIFDSTPKLWMLPESSESPIPLALYPPGLDTNGSAIFEASQSDMMSLAKMTGLAAKAKKTPQSGRRGAIMSPAATASPQSAVAPTKPPTAPMKNYVHSYAIGYYSWPSSQTVAIPKNGITFPATGVCHLDIGSSYSSIMFDNIPEAQALAQNMESLMKKHSWQLVFEKGDQNLPVNSIRRNDQGYGGGEIFTQATIGLFLDHGNYGLDPDYSAGSSGSKQTYFRSDADSGDNGWLRMCQFGFGGNLKWMAILACNSLNTFDSMKNAGAIPLKTTHMVCGCATVAAVGEDTGALWAKKMFGGFFTPPETVANAWFDAGHDQYQYATNLTGMTIVFRVAYYPECLNDTLKNNTDPYNPSPSPGNLEQTPRQVYP